jgi:hypothetical protein
MVQNIRHNDVFFLSLIFFMLKYLDGFLFRDQLYNIFRVMCVKLQGAFY